MSAALIGVCLLSVLSLCVVNVMAVAPCDQNIINNLKTKSSCYPRGVVPSQRAQSILYTTVASSSGELPPLTQCVTGFQGDRIANVNIFLPAGLRLPVTYTLEFKGDHILETDSFGGTYRIYVFLNGNGAYGYYKCHEPGTLGNGRPTGVIYVGCQSVNDGKTQASVSQAKSCFYQLGITNVINVNPCVC